MPLGSDFLVYNPLRGSCALINAGALSLLRQSLNGYSLRNSTLAPLWNALTGTYEPLRPRQGPITSPLFLGLIPTRGCNMGCHYCDFSAPKYSDNLMTTQIARDALDAYFALLQEANQTVANVHFFGGEPFQHEQVIHFAVGYAELLAEAAGISARFEVTTNGLYSASRCRWIADHFDAVVLSLDGLPDVHDRHRPALNGKGTFDPIARNAKILSEGSVELIVRACVTADSVGSLADFAQWIAETLRPSTVCFETLSFSAQADASGMKAPDPVEFARSFERAAQVLREYGITTVTSTAVLDGPRLSFCPIGKDALIVSPDGAVDACYLLREEWNASGLDLRIGEVCSDAQNGAVFGFDSSAVERVRQMTVYERPLCAECLCRYHCAGGCHVHHATDADAGNFDALCVQTRLITVAGLLRRLGRDDLADRWISDGDFATRGVWQRSDRLEKVGTL